MHNKDYRVLLTFKNKVQPIKGQSKDVIFDQPEIKNRYLGDGIAMPSMVK